MAIVFGTGSVRLKSFTPSELNIQDAVPVNSAIELRSRYFHLFWIPFFPIGKIWTVVHGRKHYSLDTETEKQIELKKYSRNHPVYLFAGTALIVGFVLFVYGWNRFYFQAGRRTANKQIEKNNEMIEKKIAEADTTDFFLFDFTSSPEKSSLMKEIGLKGDSLQFRKKVIKLQVWQVDSVKLSYIAPSFNNGGDTLVISKEDIRQSYKSPGTISFGSSGVDLLKDGVMYRLWNIFRVAK